jgi:hypothetical protein
MDEAERRRQLIAQSLYLEARSHALVNHSRELCIEAQQLRARLETLWALCVDLSQRGCLAPWPRRR